MTFSSTVNRRKNLVTVGLSNRCPSLLLKILRETAVSNSVNFLAVLIGTQNPHKKFGIVWKPYISGVIMEWSV